MVLAGVVVSGNPGAGNYQFLSIVIGTEEGVQAIMKWFGNKQVHMNNVIGSNNQREIISQLRFDRKDCIGFCYKIDLSSTIKNMKIKSFKSNNITKSAFSRRPITSYGA